MPEPFQAATPTVDLEQARSPNRSKRRQDAREGSRVAGAYGARVRTSNGQDTTRRTAYSPAISIKNKSRESYSRSLGAGLGFQAGS